MKRLVIIDMDEDFDLEDFFSRRNISAAEVDFDVGCLAFETFKDGYSLVVAVLNATTSPEERAREQLIRDLRSEKWSPPQVVGSTLRSLLDQAANEIEDLAKRVK